MSKEENFEELLNESMKKVNIEKTVTGNIIDITSKGEIFVNLGYKADGIIPKSEYSDNEHDNPRDEFKIGNTITADVIKMNDGLGNVLLSYKKAKYRKDKNEFEQKVKNNEIIEGKIAEITDKGLVINNNGIRVFIPLSLAGKSKAASINSLIRFKVIEYEPKQRKVIGSIRIIEDEEKKKEKDEFWNKVKQGDTYEGVVQSISSYGAFINIGAVQGLLHVSEMSWSKNINPNDILKVGQQIKVKIKEIDTENRRLKLSYEEKGKNPWEDIDEKYNINDVVKVEVVKIMPFGVFVQLEEGIEGLVHISQICEKRISKPEEFLKVGQHVNAKILNIDKEKNKIELSIKELEGTSKEYIEEL